MHPSQQDDVYGGLNVVPGPVFVRILDAIEIMFDADGVAHLIEVFFPAGMTWEEKALAQLAFLEFVL